MNSYRPVRDPYLARFFTHAPPAMRPGDPPRTPSQRHRGRLLAWLFTERRNHPVLQGGPMSKQRTIRCPEHSPRGCVNCGGTGRVEADHRGRPWWESEFALPDTKEDRCG